MSNDDERDEAIAEARIAGTSSRALAKQYGCSNREIEEAIDRRLSYELDQRQRLRLVKLSVGRIEALLKLFFEKVMKDKDVAAGTLCCKLEERLALLLGLDAPTAQHIDLYTMPKEHEVSGHEQIRAAVMRVARGPNWQPNGNGALAPPVDDQNRPEPDEH